MGDESASELTSSSSAGFIRGNAMTTQDQTPGSSDCPHAWLEAQFRKRCRKNPRYSQRAFAQAIGIGSGRLSQLISRKRAFTPALGEQIAKSLQLAPDETSTFLSLIANKRDGKRDDWRTSKIKALAKGDAPTLRDLTSEQMAIIENPLYFTILSLMETSDFRPDCVWIARRLRRTPEEINAALARMERTGMIARRQDGAIVRLNGPGFKTSDGVRSEAIRKAQRAIMDNSSRCLWTVPVEQRDMTSMIVAIDPKKIPEAKELIAEFRRKLSAMLETGERTEVYSIGIQLCPLTDTQISVETEKDDNLCKRS
jgi:uncharacterized protein (TIGR02147 family)